MGQRSRLLVALTSSLALGSCTAATEPSRVASGYTLRNGLETARPNS